MNSFFAHLHPVIVHLPIGILLLAALFDWLSIRAKYAYLAPAIPVLLRFGAAAALLACGSGWLLGQSGEYDAELLGQHQWLGFATAAASLTACIAPYRRVFSTLTAMLLTLAGHQGGTLTHGEGYLSAAFETRPSLTRPAEVQEAAAFQDVVSVILQEKCVSCHGSAKQKGDLRLDTREGLMKGGKNGAAIVPGSAASGELIRRCLLPLGHDEHMPPKEKPQLTSAEMDILQWWLASGADFQQKIKALTPPASVMHALTAWSEGEQASPTIEPEWPTGPVAPPPAAVMSRLRRAGVLLLPVQQNSHWLEVSLVNVPQPADSVFPLLAQLAPQTVALKLSGCQIPESAWPLLGKLMQLRRLSLDHSSVNDAALAHLGALQELRVLSLAHTQVSAQGLAGLSILKKLKRVYVYGTQATSTQIPGVTIDTGGYQLPFLESDTARLKGGY